VLAVREGLDRYPNGGAKIPSKQGD